MPLPPELPDTIDFHLPTSTDAVPYPLDFENVQSLYSDLVTWCWIQRFWYYVLSDPQATDIEYDVIEYHVKAIEAENPDWLEHNRYSPSKTVGSHRVEDYPPFVLDMFLKVPEYHAQLYDLLCDAVNRHPLARKKLMGT